MTSEEFLRKLQIHAELFVKLAEDEAGKAEEENE